GVFALCLGAVIAGGYINAALHPAPDYTLGADGKITAVKPVKAAKGGEGHGGEGGGEGKAAIYYAIDPPLVVNFEEGSAVRFLQITMEVMASDQKAIDGVTRNVPLIRNNLLLLMSNRDYQSLMSREGKEKLRQEALTEVRSILKKQDSPAIDDLLFTSFVVQ
ncbi:MAG: flagellar basal body-associated protein FliL, partial [Steroidobacterales bacterium]